jgi:hypothetical protein
MLLSCFFLLFSRILIFHFRICFSVILSFFVAAAVLLGASVPIFFFEKPDVLIESHFGSVVTGNWWALLTLVAFGSVITCAGLPTVSDCR